MKSTAAVFIMVIILFSANARSEVRFKIPSQAPTPVQKQPTRLKPAAPSKTVLKGAYIMTIQVGSFKTRKQADREALRLKSHAVPVMIKQEQISGKGAWYRVYVGQFSSRQDAIRYEKELKRSGIISSSWVKRIKLSPEKRAARKPSPQKVQSVKPTPKPIVKKPAAPPPIVQQTPPPQKRITQPVPKQVATPRPPATRPKKQPPLVAQKTKPYKPPQSEAPEEIVEYRRPSMYPGRISVGFRGAGLAASSASSFKITRTTATDTTNWAFEDYELFAGIAVNVRIDDQWSIEASAEQVILSDADIQFLSLGPKWHFTRRGDTRPYLRAAVVYGSLKWSEAPGDFDTALGAELGAGVDFIRSKHFSISVDAAYRHTSFSYNLPSDPEISASGSELDYSGFTAAGIVRYHF